MENTPCNWCTKTGDLEKIIDEENIVCVEVKCFTSVGLTSFGKNETYGYLCKKLIDLEPILKKQFKKTILYCIVFISHTITKIY